jgi:PAS domain S-box-containing protein
MTQPAAGRKSETPADALTEAAREQGELERFFALSTDLLCVADFNGFLKRVNPAFERVLGYSREEVVSEPFMNFVHPDDREATLGEYASVLSGGESLEFENRWRCHDGSYRWLQWATATDRDADLIYAIARDVTKAKQTAAKVQTLLAEQAALRRVATLVAREGEGERVEVFAVVAEEVGRLLAADAAGVVRYEPDSQGVIVGAWSRAGEPPLPSDSVIRFDAGTAVGRVYRTGQPGRSGPFEGPEGSVAHRLKDLGYQSSLATPIHAEGRVWGALGVGVVGEEPLPEESNRRLAGFAKLIAQALANADAREQLAASRARLVQASDAERRRLERNLHDGAQQRLVALSLTLKLVRSRIAADPDDALSLVDAASGELAAALTDLRELAHGIHPAVLSERGLAEAITAVAERTRFPVEIASMPAERLPESVEVATYYLVSEAFTNIAKYAQASSATLAVSRAEDRAIIEVSDDGIGGADLTRGSGLRGLGDRIGALGGRLEIESPRGRGTTIRATIPLQQGKT